MVDPHFRMPPDHLALGEATRKMPVGTVFYWRGRMWRMGRGIVYAAHTSDPIIERAFRQRMKRRANRMRIKVELS